MIYGQYITTRISNWESKALGEILQAVTEELEKRAERRSATKDQELFEVDAETPPEDT